MLSKVLRVTDHPVLWIHTRTWFIGERDPFWSSVQSVYVRILFFLPDSNKAGTLISNFLGKYHLARELSAMCSRQIICDYSMGQYSLACGWDLSFGLLMTLTEQLNSAFELFDATKGCHEVRRSIHSYLYS